MIRAAPLVAGLLLGGCSLAGEPSSGEWMEPEWYSYVLESRCGERTLLGRFEIEVQHGAVVSWRASDASGRAAATALRPQDLPTLAGLLAHAGEARAGGGADRVDLVTDPADGRPVSLEIDWRADATDDEECYTASDLRVVDP